MQLQKPSPNTSYQEFQTSVLTSYEVHWEERILNTKPRLTGEPIMRILCKKTGSLTGYLYQWDNGDLQPAWFDDAMTDIRYEPFDQHTERSPLDQRDAGRRPRDPSRLENV